MLESPDDSVSVEKAASNEMLNVLKYNAASDEASCLSATHPHVHERSASMHDPVRRRSAKDFALGLPTLRAESQAAVTHHTLL